MLHMNRVSAQALLLALVVGSIHCGPSQGKLDGDVFIVTQGGVSVKLGLVEVLALPYEETRQAVALVDAEAIKLKRDAAAAVTALASAEAELNQLLADEKALLNRASTNSKADRTAIVAAHDREDAATEVRDSAKQAVAELVRKAHKLTSGALYFEKLPPPLVTTKTDADGKFSLPLDRKVTVVLAAHAARRVFGEDEDYYWLVKASLDGQLSKRIFLSNDNLPRSGSSGSLIHTVD